MKKAIKNIFFLDFLPKKKIKKYFFFIILLLLKFSISQCFAFDLFGIHLWGEKKTQEQDVKKYRVAVFATDDHANIVKKNALSIKDDFDTIDVVKLSSNLFLDQNDPPSSSISLLTKAHEDYNNILHAFYAQGCYSATISIRINGTEVTDIAPATILPKFSYITIMVNPGKPYVFSRAVIHNYPNFQILKAPKTRKQIEQLNFAKNNIAKSKYIFQAEEITIQKWRLLGYAKAKVKNKKVIANHSRKTIMADIWIDPGPKVHYKRILIQNLSSKPDIKNNFILWVLNLKIGETYNPLQLESARERLERLGVFQEQLINEGTIDKNGGLTIKVIVRERPPHRFGLGGTYSSLDGFSLTTYLLFRNLFGNAENLRANIDINNINNFKFHNFQAENFFFNAGLTYVKPSIFYPDNDWRTSLNNQREKYIDYQTNSLTLQTGFSYKINSILSGYTYLETSKIITKKKNSPTQNFFTFGLLNELLYDDRDSSTNPSDGRYNETIINPFYEGIYQNLIAKITSEERHYFGFGLNNKLILALKGKVGSIFTTQSSQIPDNYLFLAGGGSSIRGYGYRTIGIVQDDPLQSIKGARSLLEGSLELRLQAFHSIGFATFIDSGVVSNKILPTNLKDIKTGLGIGAFYLTAIGPIRFDVAWPLHKNFKNLSFYIRIGQTF